MIVSRKFTFDAAHHLPGYPGKCAQVHGHSWRFEVAIGGEIKPDGMVIDFSILKKVVQPLVDQLDHTNLNDNKYLKNPTAENLAVYIFDFVDKSPLKLDVAWVTVWESPWNDSCARYNGCEVC